VMTSSWREWQYPIHGFSTDNRFWSHFRIVSLKKERRGT
jgi:hypothetical protein